MIEKAVKDQNNKNNMNINDVGSGADMVSQEKDTNPVIKALGEMFQVKSIRYRIIAFLLVIVLLISVVILRSVKKGSEKVTQDISQGNETGFSPGAEVELPQDEVNTTQNEITPDQSKINKEQSPPESIVIKFLEYNKVNDRNSAASLLSSKAKEDAYRPTINGTDTKDSLYGKDFDYNIFNTYIEENGPLSRVSVEISSADEYYINVYILIWEDNSWKLLSKEVIEPVVRSFSEE